MCIIMNTELPRISLHESDFMLPCLFVYVTTVVLSEKNSWHAFCWNPLGRPLVLIQLLVIPKHLCGNVFHNQTTVPLCF